MSKRRHNTSRSENTTKAHPIGVSDRPASTEIKWSEKDVAQHGGMLSHVTTPTALHKYFLAVAIALEIGWVVFLVVLAATK